MEKLVTLLLLLSLNSFGYSIISDLDDTIKITGKGIRAVLNGLTSEKTYIGMPQLLEEMDEKKLYVLTASPNQLRSQIYKLFRKNNMNVHQLITKSWFSGESKYDYKYRNVERIILESDENFILMGDNTSHDPHVYHEIQQKYPERVLAIYIRDKKGEIDEIEGINYFFHTADIALNELKQKRLKRIEVLKILKSFLTLDRDFKYIFTRSSYCPVEESEFNTPSVLGISQIVDVLNKELVIRCRDRNS